MTIDIHPIGPDDFADTARMLSLTQRFMVATPDALAAEFAARKPHHLVSDVVAYDNGMVIGRARLGHSAMFDTPTQWVAKVWVQPDARHRGVGAALWDRVTTEASTWEPAAGTNVISFLELPDDDAERFAQARGFVENGRKYESILAPGNATPDRVTGFSLAEGIRLTTLSGLEQQRPDDVAAIHHALHEVGTAASEDIPTAITVTADLDPWLDQFVRNPIVRKDAFFVALDGDDIVGFSTHWETGGRLLVALSAVRRTHRRLGIARALKIAGISYAADQGLTLRTYNDGDNTAIRNLNRDLGFEIVSTLATWGRSWR